MCLNAGAMGRIDAESETLIPVNRCVFDVALPPAIAFPERMSGTQYGAMENVSGALGALNPQAVAYAIQERAVSENPNSGPDGIGVQGDIAYTLEARQQVQGVAHPYTLAIRGRGDEGNLEYRQDGTANAVLTPNGGRAGIGVGAIATQWAVRRLTPTEAERLQAFPDGYTDILRNGKPAADGPRYKALGNSMAVNVMSWIGQRIQIAHDAHPPPIPRNRGDYLMAENRKIEDGGPAFPKDGPFAAHGMSLRDWFAGQALAGIIANPHNEREVTFIQMGKDVYTFADAMIEARKGGT